MRILQVIPCHTHRGGAEDIVRRLHAGLNKLGIESHILDICKKPVCDLPNLHSLNKKHHYDPTAAIFMARFIRQTNRNFDIIHAHLFPAQLCTAIAIKLARWNGIFVSTEHSTSNRRRGTLLGRLLDIINYSSIDHIACISQGVLRNLADWKPALREKMSVVENGVDLYFEKIIPRLTSKQAMIVSVGRLKPMKNYINALKALSMLEDLEFKYMIAGEGKALHELQSLACRLNLTDKVKLLGYVQDVPALLKKADIFLIPSLWEGFGLAVVEAMNAGLPVVASDIDGLREIVQSPNPCAILVNPTEPQSISMALRELINSPEMRKKYGRNAFKKAKQYNESKMIDSYIQLYSKLLE